MFTRGTVFLSGSDHNDANVLLHLHFDESTNMFSQIKRLQHPISDVIYMEYISKDNLLIMSSWISGQLTAVKIDDNIMSIVWQVTGPVEGKIFGARGICTDDDGRVYLADLKSRIIVFDGCTGKPLQVLLEGKGMGGIGNVLWVRSTNQLFVKHYHGAGATIFDITPAD